MDLSQIRLIKDVDIIGLRVATLAFSAEVWSLSITIIDLNRAAKYVCAREKVTSTSIDASLNDL